MDTVEVRQQRQTRAYYGQLRNLLTREVKSAFEQTGREMPVMETAETYLGRAQAADLAAEAAADDQARRMLQAVAQRWRQLAELAQLEEKRESSKAT